MTILRCTQPATRWLSIMVLTGVMLPMAGPVHAQGPLTAALPEEPPAVVAYRIGPIQLSPNFTLSEIGVDTNVFDEPVDPKRDYMLALSPTLAAYMRSGLVQFVFTSGTDFTYYQTFKSERSIARQLRGRLDFLFSRFRPSLAAALVDTRKRPNFEIDLRARRHEKEVSAGVAFELSPLARIYGGVARVETEYDDTEIFRGIGLGAALNRRGEQTAGGARLALTPFTTLTVETVFSRDRFVASPARDSDSLAVNGSLGFSAAAVVNGTVKVGYKQFSPKDATIAPYSGLVTAVNLGYTAFWRGKLSMTLERDVQYSFEEAEGYFLGTGGEFVYTQRVLGPLDVQALYGFGRLDYGNRAGADARVDHAATYGGGVGYNRNDGARLGITYEYSQRQSDERPDRRFTRRRLYGSLTYKF